MHKFTKYIEGNYIYTIVIFAFFKLIPCKYSTPCNNLIHILMLYIFIKLGNHMYFNVMHPISSPGSFY